MKTIEITFEKLIELCMEQKQMASGDSYYDTGEPRGQNYIVIKEVKYSSSTVAFDEYMNQSRIINKKLRGE